MDSDEDVNDTRDREAVQREYGAQIDSYHLQQRYQGEFMYDILEERIMPPGDRPIKVANAHRRKENASKPPRLTDEQSTCTDYYRLKTINREIEEYSKLNDPDENDLIPPPSKMVEVSSPPISSAQSPLQQPSSSSRKYSMIASYLAAAIDEGPGTDSAILADLLISPFDIAVAEEEKSSTEKDGTQKEVGTNNAPLLSTGVEEHRGNNHMVLSNDKDSVEGSIELSSKVEIEVQIK